MPPPGHGFDAASHERHHWWRSLLLRLAVCSALTGLLWRVGGWTSVLISLMLWGRVFAADLIELGGLLWRALRGQALKPVEGRLYQFKGQHIRVLDDEVEPRRWLAVADLARALGESLPLGPLRRLQREPDSALREEGDGWYVVDDVALAALGERRSDRAARLRVWVEREVWYPARGRRASYGPAKGAPEGAPDD
jgi:hypothetical protein